MKKYNFSTPIEAKISEIQNLTTIEKLVKLEFTDKEFSKNFTYLPGQFVEVGIPRVGESAISICTAQKNDGILELCIRKAGMVTHAIHRLRKGDKIWVRGPYGNSFPMEKMEGSNLLLIAGGLGIAPLRGVLQYALINREKYADINLLYGVKCYDNILFKEEILGLFRSGDKNKVNVYLSYEDETDQACYQLKCERNDRCIEGVITKLFQSYRPQAENTYAIICGPPTMYKFVTKELIKNNFKPKQIYMTMERRMRCGVGKCGHCIVGSSNSIKFVCKDGPVFTYWDALNIRGLI